MQDMTGTDIYLRDYLLDEQGFTYRVAKIPGALGIVWAFEVDPSDEGPITKLSAPPVELDPRHIAVIDWTDVSKPADALRTLWRDLYDQYTVAHLAEQHKQRRMALILESSNAT